MDKFEILSKLEEHGFKAFIVGGYVRDYLLGIESCDVDITTSATPVEVCETLKISSKENLGCITLKIDGMHIDITTLRKEKNYKDRHPEVTFIDDLEEDLRRRDFTINAICMDKSKRIIDPLNGREALERRCIETIGNTETKLREDPLRMLRAIRLAAIYGFTLDETILEFIKTNRSLIKSLSYERKKTELDKILCRKEAIEGLNLLKRLRLLETLEIDVPDDFVRTEDVLGCWAELRFADRYPFTKKERAKIEAIRKIVSGQKIDKITLFEHDLEDVLCAGEIMGYSREKIVGMVEAMPIHSPDDLALSNRELMEMLENDIPKMKSVKNDLINRILSGNLLNSVEHIKIYIIENWK